MQDRARANPKIEFIFDTTVDEVIGSKEKGVSALKLRNLKTGAITFSLSPAGGSFAGTGTVMVFHGGRAAKDDD